MNDAENDEDEPLDPAMERVRRKLVRLLFVSTGIMVLGLFAVVAGIFYRVSQMDKDDGPPEPVALAIDVGDLIATSVGEDKLVLTVGGATPRIEVRRLSDGALVGLFPLEGDGPAQ